MVSKEAKVIKENLFKRKDLYYLLNTDIKIQRKDWEDSAINTKLPKDTVIRKVVTGDIKGELISSKNSQDKQIILYFHGGGLVLGSCITHRKLGANLVKYTNIPVFIHDYPLAPEFPYPLALENSEHVYFWLIKQGYQPNQIIFGGDSSGCALGLSLILKLKELHQPLPKGMFMFSPMLDFTLSGKTIKSLATNDPCLFEEDIQISVNHYCQKEDPKNPFITPLYGSFNNFPPVLIQVGSEEMLLDDSLCLKDKIESVNSVVKLEIWEGMWHVFQSNVSELPEAKQAFKNICFFINELL